MTPRSREPDIMLAVVLDSHGRGPAPRDAPSLRAALDCRLRLRSAPGCRGRLPEPEADRHVGLVSQAPVRACERSWRVSPACVAPPLGRYAAANDILMTSR